MVDLIWILILENDFQENQLLPKVNLNKLEEKGMIQREYDEQTHNG